MSQLVAQTRVKGLLNCLQDGDWYAIYTLLEQCDENVRATLATAIVSQQIGTPEARSKALEFLTQCRSPMTAIRAALFTLTLR